MLGRSLCKSRTSAQWAEFNSLMVPSDRLESMFPEQADIARANLVHFIHATLA
jgi:hypothetical protein